MGTHSDGKPVTRYGFHGPYWERKRRLEENAKLKAEGIDFCICPMTATGTRIDGMHVTFFDHKGYGCERENWQPPMKEKQDGLSTTTRNDPDLTDTEHEQHGTGGAG